MVTQPLKRTMLRALFIAALLAALIAGAVLYVAFQHNPQGAFFDPQTGSVDVVYAFLLFLSWWIPALMLLCAIAAIAILIRGWRRGR